jgi:hypothetical protein
VVPADSASTLTGLDAGSIPRNLIAYAKFGDISVRVSEESEADINALCAIAPLPRAPFPGHHAPSPHAAAPLEPQAQINLQMKGPPMQLPSTARLGSARPTLGVASSHLIAGLLLRAVTSLEGVLQQVVLLGPRNTAFLLVWSSRHRDRSQWHLECRTPVC